MPNFTVAIIGVGPRGTYAFIRLLAVLRAYTPSIPITIHLIEGNEFGAGLVYRTSQPDYLLMNTVASQITAFTDESIRDAAPQLLGPTLYQWLTGNGYDISPEEYPSRSQHGRYLNWVVFDALRHLPNRTTVALHNSPALDVYSDYPTKKLVLQDGTTLHADMVLLTAGNIGNQDPRPSLLVRGTTSSWPKSVKYVSDPYPVESKIGNLPQSANVGILGLGLTSIDVILTLTVGRGGTFRRAEDGELRYHASGTEPKLFAWSRSGRPLLSRGRNQKGVTGQHQGQFLTLDIVKQLKLKHGKLDFRTQILPLVIGDMAYAYYKALKGSDFAERFRFGWQRGEDNNTLLDDIPLADRFDWKLLIDPPELVGTTYPNSEEYNFALLQYLERDLVEAKRGNLESPIKAACDVLRDIRDNIRFAVEFESLTPASHRYFNEVFSPINNRLAVGPPAIRTEQLVALVRCGILDMAWGQNARITVPDDGASVILESTAFHANREVKLDVVVDGRANPLYSEFVKKLLLRRMARLAVNHDALGGFELRTLEVTQDGMVVNASGEVDEHLHAMGQLAEGTLWYTQVAARPGVNSRAIRDSGRWAMYVHQAVAAKSQDTKSQDNKSII